MFIIQKQLNTDTENCELISPLVKLDEALHCQACPCYEGKNRSQHFISVTYSNPKTGERAYLLFLNAFALYYGHIQFECLPGKLISERMYSEIS